MNRIYNISIQWHITGKCGNRCRHCYMFDEKTYEDEIKNELELSGLLKILESISEFEKKWNCSVNSFAITGGDPFLYPEWKEFLNELKVRNKKISLMGNPETITDENLTFLREAGISSFQMSLDGLKNMHDSFRGKGSFARTVKALEKLKEASIRSNIMFTLYPENKEHLIPLMNFVVKETESESFSFDIGTSTGNASALVKGFTKDEIKNIFTSYRLEKKRLKEEGFETRISEKNNLFKLLKYEEGRFYPQNNKEVSSFSGCLIGYNSVCILSDGTVLACRRFPLKAGKMPEQTFEDVFLGSEVLRKFRRPDYYTHCGACGFFQHCRGCPAVVNGLTGDPFGPHPFCFKDSIKRPISDQTICYPPIDITFEEEYELIAKNFQNMLLNKINDIIKSPGARNTLLWALQSDERKELFLSDPQNFSIDNDLSLSDFERFYIRHFLIHVNKDTKEYEMIYEKLFLASFWQ